MRGAKGKIVAVAARREVVRQLQGLGMSERQALRLMDMSPSTLRYRPCGDGNSQALLVDSADVALSKLYTSGNLSGAKSTDGGQTWRLTST